MKILFIEDEIFTNKPLFEYLKEKYDIIWLQTSTDAIDYVNKNTDYGLVILDIMMAPPDGMDELEGIDIRNGYSMGLGILKLINRKNEQAKIIIFSARNDFESEKIFKQLKYDERFLKPRIVDDLVDEIEQLIKKV